MNKILTTCTDPVRIDKAKPVSVGLSKHMKLDPDSPWGREHLIDFKRGEEIYFVIRDHKHTPTLTLTLHPVLCNKQPRSYLWKERVMIRFVLCCLFGLLPHTIAAQDITPLTRPTLFLLFDSSGSAHGINATGSTSAGARDFFWTGVKLALQQDEIVNRLVSCQYDLRSLAWSDAEPHILSSERARSADDVALFVATTDTNMREAANALGNGTSPSTGLTAVTNELLRDEGVVPVVLLLYDGSGYTQSSFDAGLREEIARRGGSIHLIGYPFQGVSDLKSLADDVATPPTDAVVAVPMVSAEYPDIIAHILRFACQFHGA